MCKFGPVAAGPASQLESRDFLPIGSLFFDPLSRGVALGVKSREIGTGRLQMSRDRIDERTATLNRLNDRLFKFIFASEHHKDILIRFLNSV